MRASLMKSWMILGLLCFAFSIVGCKPSFPYYTTEGSMESREIHVHVAEGQVIEVPCGLGAGGGITQEDRLSADENGEIVKEQDGVKVVLTLKSGGAVITIKEVYYNGTPCTAFEEVL